MRSDTQLNPAPAPASTMGTTGVRPAWQKALVALLAVVLPAALGIWLVGRLRPPELHGTVMQTSEAAADFTLTGTDGQPVSLSDLRGKWTALYFGYSFCPDVCPTTLADLNSMTNALGRRADDMQVVFISLDPKRDTPERVGKYVSFFNPSFKGMTGSTETVDAAATQFGIFHEQRQVEGASGYLIDHTSTVLVLDPDGRMRIVFPYGVSGADMAADLLYFMRRG